MSNIVYAVGVGPGDPELLTLRAVRLIKNADVIAVPAKVATDSVAYQIAVQAVPEIKDKELLAIDMPMTHDVQKLHLHHVEGARRLESCLKENKQVVYLTLGDVSIYCSFSYLKEILENDGYAVELVSGIPSFCAAAARLNEPLVSYRETLRILPSVEALRAALPLRENETYVLMKSGRSMKLVKEMLSDEAYKVSVVENCGMPDEKITEELSDRAGYFSLVIIRKI